MVAFNKKGLAVTPKMTRVNQYVTTSGTSWAGSLTHKKQRNSRSLETMETIKKAFFNICCDCKLMNVKASEDVENPLIKFWSRIWTLVDGGSGRLDRCIIYHTEFRGCLASSDDCMVREVVHSWNIHWILYTFYNSLCQLSLDYNVILMEDVWILSETVKKSCQSLQA